MALALLLAFRIGPLVLTRSVNRFTASPASPLAVLPERPVFSALAVSMPATSEKLLLSALSSLTLSRVSVPSVCFDRPKSRSALIAVPGVEELPVTMLSICILICRTSEWLTSVAPVVATVDLLSETVLSRSFAALKAVTRDCRLVLTLLVSRVSCSVPGWLFVIVPSVLVGANNLRVTPVITSLTVLVLRHNSCPLICKCASTASWPVSGAGKSRGLTPSAATAVVLAVKALAAPVLSEVRTIV